MALWEGFITFLIEGEKIVQQNVETGILTTEQSCTIQVLSRSVKRVNYLVVITERTFLKCGDVKARNRLEQINIYFTHTFTLGSISNKLNYFLFLFFTSLEV